MKSDRLWILCTASLLATSAWAQSTPRKPLNLELPPSDLATARSHAKPARSASSASAAPATSIASRPGVYYGDTSGRVGAVEPAETPSCDDATYGQPHVHGSVEGGVVAGNHVDGSYEGGHVRITRAFGDCEHPSGSMSISVGVRRDRFDGRPRR